MYFPADLLIKGIVPFTVYKIYQGLWAKITEERREELIQSYGKGYVVDDSVWEEAEPMMDRFKSGEIGYEELQKIVVRTLSRAKEVLL